MTLEEAKRAKEDGSLICFIDEPEKWGTITCFDDEETGVYFRPKGELYLRGFAQLYKIRLCNNPMKA